MDLKYRLITGVDSAGFCERISKLLEEGYELYGSPSITSQLMNGRAIKFVAQAVVRKDDG